MKRYTVLLLIVFSIIGGNVWSQCTSCTPNPGNCPPAGGLCNKLDTAYAHHPYDKVITFYMPHYISSPAILSQCSCNSVELRQIRVTGVSGLPTGVSYLISNNGTFNVSSGDTMGCAHFCGTPLLAGVYPVTVYLEADVTAYGTPIGNVTQNNNAQSYKDTLYVLADTVGGVSSFTFGNNGSEACDSLTINLNALLTAPQPNMTRYFWNIGGQPVEAKTPGQFTFTNTSLVPDTIPVTLTTVYYKYRVKKVHIGNVTGGYCGDIEEVTCSCISGADSPDPYIKFPVLGFDNSGSYASNTCHNINFDNLYIDIPVGTSTVAMEIWDKDNGPPFGSQDDHLGNDTIPVQLGSIPFSDNNDDGFVEFDTAAGTVITETLLVIVNPLPPVPMVTASSDTFCSNDSVLIGINMASQYGAGYAYQWFNDTTFLIGVADTAFYTQNPGKYYTIVTNSSTGCSSTSAKKKVSVAQSPNPAQIVFTGVTNGFFLNPFPNGPFSADWYYNDQLVTGQTGRTLPYLGNGTYTATIYNSTYPQCRVEVQQDSVFVGIDEVAGGVNSLTVSPNPGNGKFNIQFNAENVSEINLTIQNTLGQQVYTQKIENFNGRYFGQVDLSTLAKGAYIMLLETEKGRQTTKLIVE